MRKFAFAGAVAALVVGLATFGIAQTKPEPVAGMKGEPGSVTGAVVKLFKHEKLIQLKVEKDLGAPGPGGVEPRKEGGMGPKREGEGATVRPREGEVIFIHAAEASYRDLTVKDREKGELKDAERGWSHLKDGCRIRCEYAGTHEMPAPKEWPKEARAGGYIIVYHAKLIEILSNK